MKIYVLNLKGVKKHLPQLAVALFLALAVLFGYFMQIKIDSISASTDAKRTIVLDAGHGGEDCGAIGIDGILEKDLNLSIVKTIGEMLTDKGYEVVYTREQDIMLYSPDENIKGMRKLSDLKNRCKIANDIDNAVFVSIHMNSFGDSKYSGLQVYYADKSFESQKLASCIQRNVKNNLQKENNRTTKNGKNLYLLDNTKSTSVIVECGFLSNKEECKKLSEKDYQNELSFSIVCGIIEYINNSNNS